MKQPPRLRRTILIAAIVIFACLSIVCLAVSAFPQIAAQGADVLRKVVGDQAVAQLEMTVFQVQDTFDQVKFRLGIKPINSPWQAEGEATLLFKGTATPTSLPSPTATITLTPTPRPTDLPTLTPTLSPSPSATATATPWAPAKALILGSLEGEGAWQPYLEDGKGHTVAYRTFLQPDPLRPYVLVAAVAFDLAKVRLNFILGVEEPFAPDSPLRSGAIPAADNKPGVLLATFNGAFKSQHGNYGAMSDGIMPLKPVEGYATIAIYRNGEVRIGEWGNDLTSDVGMLAWRQNCSMVIRDGQINPLVNVDSAHYWGANLTGSTATWRSGIGLSQDGRTLYYLAGPSLTMPILARAMVATGIADGMQLDINDYWVHFVAIRIKDGKMIPEPLFPKNMTADAGRYLVPHSRDFFYVALKQP